MSEGRVRELEGLLAEATMNMIERRSLDDDIFKLAEDHKRLLVENDKLRTQVLKAPDTKMVAFIAAFELSLEARSKMVEIGAKYGYYSDPVMHAEAGRRSQLCKDLLSTWHELKSEHLEEEVEDGYG